MEFNFDKLLQKVGKILQNLLFKLENKLKIHIIKIKMKIKK